MKRFKVKDCQIMWSVTLTEACAILEEFLLRIQSVVIWKPKMAIPRMDEKILINLPHQIKFLEQPSKHLLHLKPLLALLLSISIWPSMIKKHKENTDEYQVHLWTMVITCGVIQLFQLSNIIKACILQTASTFIWKFRICRKNLNRWWANSPISDNGLLHITR
jgi:hypothetical protein